MPAIVPDRARSWIPWPIGRPSSPIVAGHARVFVDPWCNLVQSLGRAGYHRRVTVMRADSERVIYDRRRLQGVTVYREAERAFATGDRVQFTAPNREWRVTNRELRTIEHIGAGGDLQLRLDAGGTIAFTVDAHPHLDYGYAVTATAARDRPPTACSSTWTVAGQLVAKLLKDRLVFTPERRRGKLSVTESQGSIMPMLAGQIPEFQALVHGLASPMPASWNQIVAWLKQIDAVRLAA
jgi:hypothetical protein